jgi:hypothetical protein
MVVCGRESSGCWVGWLLGARSRGQGPVIRLLLPRISRGRRERRSRDGGGKQVVASMRGMMDDGVARGSAAPPPCTPARPLCGGPPTIPPWKKESLSPLLASPSRKVTLH